MLDNKKEKPDRRGFIAWVIAALSGGTFTGAVLHDVMVHDYCKEALLSIAELNNHKTREEEIKFVKTIKRFLQNAPYIYTTLDNSHLELVTKNLLLAIEKDDHKRIVQEAGSLNELVKDTFGKYLVQRDSGNRTRSKEDQELFIVGSEMEETLSTMQYRHKKKVATEKDPKKEQIFSEKLTAANAMGFVEGGSGNSVDSVLVHEYFEKAGLGAIEPIIDPFTPAVTVKVLEKGVADEDMVITMFQKLINEALTLHGNHFKNASKAVIQNVIKPAFKIKYRAVLPEWLEKLDDKSYVALLEGRVKELSGKEAGGKAIGIKAVNEKIEWVWQEMLDVSNALSRQGVFNALKKAGKNYALIYAGDNHKGMFKDSEIISSKTESGYNTFDVRVKIGEREVQIRFYGTSHGDIKRGREVVNDVSKLMGKESEALLSVPGDTKFAQNIGRKGFYSINETLAHLANDVGVSQSL